jgi:hypothetical protein
VAGSKALRCLNTKGKQTRHQLLELTETHVRIPGAGEEDLAELAAAGIVLYEFAAQVSHSEVHEQIAGGWGCRPNEPFPPQLARRRTPEQAARL